MKECRRIGTIENFDGGLFVKEYKGKYYWIIQNYDYNYNDIRDWEEISKSLYDKLLKHEKHKDN